MKSLLVLILVSLLTPFVLAQKTYYTTGLGEGAWDDPNSWTLSEGSTNPAGPPEATDHVVISHYLTHYAPANYIHYGSVKVTQAGTYEIIANQAEGDGYTYAGRLFDVYGTLISAGNFHHQLANSKAKGFLVFRPSSLVYFTKDLILDGAGHTIMSNTSCGASQSFRDLHFKNEDVQLYGNGKFSMGGKIRVWNEHGTEQLSDAAIFEQAQKQIGRDFSFYASDADCELEDPFITGNAEFYTNSTQLQVRVVRRGQKVEINWQSDFTTPYQFFCH